MKKLQKIAVFCGSSIPLNDKYVEDAILLGKELAKRNITLIYGGGNRGLMGVVSKTVSDNDGKVIGVLPEKMNIPSVTKDECKMEKIIVKDMHERKSMMYKLSDAFIALPGGIGTVEEISEIYTWRQLKYTDKNIALFNTLSFWDPYIEMLRAMCSEGFLKEEVFSLLIVDNNPVNILDRLENEEKEAPNKL